MALKYTTVDAMLVELPKVGSETAITSAQMYQMASHAEAQIDARLAKWYQLPISGSPPLLVSIATEFACYKLVALRIMTEGQLKDSAWPARFKESLDSLDRLVKSEDSLVDSSGQIISQRSDLAPILSNTMDYNPASSELDPITWVIDPDKISDLEADRNK